MKRRLLMTMIWVSLCGAVALAEDAATNATKEAVLEFATGARRTGRKGRGEAG